MSLADRYLLYMGDDDLVRIEVAGFPRSLPEVSVQRDRGDHRTANT